MVFHLLYLNLKIFVKQGCDIVRSTTLRHYSCSVGLRESEHNKKSVYVSQSSDIFYNLALEDWFYRNGDFTNHHILLLWRNDPCVVIGRHQNPWLEASILTSSLHGVKLARRNSGGGTVYHDQGNLNMTFFTPRNKYCRRRNLELISRALLREYGISSQINSREDIVIQDKFKISGTAAKLGRPNAYHHCTLLVSVNKSLLSRLLQTDYSITTKATQSIRSPVLNLSELDRRVSVEQLSNAIGREYLHTCSSPVDDCVAGHVLPATCFQTVNPTEVDFPGLEKIREDFSSWEWRFGRTPPFTLSKSFFIPKEIGLSVPNKTLGISVTVNNGIIEDINTSSDIPLLDISILESLKGRRFSSQSVTKLDEAYEKFSSLANENSFLINCVKKLLVLA